MTPDETAFFTNLFYTIRREAMGSGEFRISRVQWLEWWEQCALRTDRYEHPRKYALVRIDATAAWSKTNLKLILRSDATDQPRQANKTKQLDENGDRWFTWHAPDGEHTRYRLISAKQWLAEVKGQVNIL